MTAMATPEAGAAVPGGSGADEVAARVARIAEPIVAALGLVVADVRYGGTRAGGTLRVTIDKPGGVTLEDCTRVSRSLGHALDVEEAIDHRYTLEVSSPGLDRPLHGPGDYERAIGRLVRIKTRPPWDGPRVVVGRLAGVESAAVRVAVEHEGERVIPWSAIAQGKLEVEW